MPLPVSIERLLAADPVCVRAVWMRNFVTYRRTWVANILPNFFEPLLFLAGMGLGVGEIVAGGPDAYLAFIGPGLLAAAAMNGASFETTYNFFVKIHFGKLYDAFLATPAEVEDIVLGELLWAVTRALLYGLGFLVVLLGLTLLGKPILTSPLALLLPLLTALTGLVFALLGMAFTARIESIDLYSYYFTLFISPLFLFSGIFYPVENLPAGALVANLSPLFHAVRLARGLSCGALGLEHVASFAALAALALALLWHVPGAVRKRLSR